MKKNITLLEFASKISSNPLIMHINPVGMLRMGSSNMERFEKLNGMFLQIQNYGGSLAVPTYSYSYTNNEIYDVINTESTLDILSEYLRKKNIFKRTMDPNFSYLLFGDCFSDKHYTAINYNSFGEGGMIDELFQQDGYLGAIGGAFEYLTEIHYIERKLNVNYRFDKKFHGVTIGYDRIKKYTTLNYFCKNRDFYSKVSLVKLKKDLIENQLVEEFFIKEHNLKIEIIKIKCVSEFIEEKLLANPEYLWGKVSE